MPRENLLQALLVTDITAFQRSPLHRPVVPFFHRVEADGPVANLSQRLADMAADIAGPAGNEDCVRHAQNNGSGPVLRSASARNRMVPGEGFEPPTFGLQNRCTTAVLTRPCRTF